MKNRYITIILLLIVQLSFAAVTISIKAPGDWAKLDPCNTVIMEADIQTTEGEEIKEVRYYGDGLQLCYSRKAPYSAEWENPKTGHYIVEAKVKDKSNNEYWSEPIHVTVGNIDDHELLKNTTFDCGSFSPWRLQLNNNAVATAEVMDDAYFDEGGYVMFDITDGSDTNWHIQFSQMFQLDSLHTYQVYFWADADDIKTIQIAFQENGGDWAWYAGTDVTIEGMDEYGPVTYECMVNQPRADVKFNCGGNNINWYLDNVQLLDDSFNSVKSTTFGKNPVEFELYQSYPNPFNMNATIEYRLAQTDYARLNIVNTNGQLVKTLVDGQQSEGMHKVTWDGFDNNGHAVPSGVYFYTLKAGSSSKTRAVHKKMILVK